MMAIFLMRKMGLEKLSRVILTNPSRIQTQVHLILLSGRHRACVPSPSAPFSRKTVAAKVKHKILFKESNQFIHLSYLERNILGIAKMKLVRREKSYIITYYHTSAVFKEILPRPQIPNKRLPKWMANRVLYAKPSQFFSSS